MKISTNNIGNYTLNTRPQQVSSPAISSKPDFDKSTAVSNNEKEFFSKMYPENRSDIINYHFYGSRGNMAGVSVGKNIDRKI